MAGHEVGAGHQVRAERIGSRPEAQVGDGDAARLLRVVDEVALGEVGRVLADDLDGVLVGAHRAVGAQAPEVAADHVLALGLEGGVVGEREVGDVVVDAHREVALGAGVGQLVVDRLHHGRRELLGGEAVAAADHGDLVVEAVDVGLLRLAQRRDHVLVERLAEAARLLGAVEHGDGGGRCGAAPS